MAAKNNVFGESDDPESWISDVTPFVPIDTTHATHLLLDGDRWAAVIRHLYDKNDSVSDDPSVKDILTLALTCKYIRFIIYGSDNCSFLWSKISFVRRYWDNNDTGYRWMPCITIGSDEEDDDESDEEKRHYHEIQTGIRGVAVELLQSLFSFGLFLHNVSKKVNELLISVPDDPVEVIERWLKPSYLETALKMLPHLPCGKKFTLDCGGMGRHIKILKAVSAKMPNATTLIPGPIYGNEAAELARLWPELTAINLSPWQLCTIRESCDDYLRSDCDYNGLGHCLEALPNLQRFFLPHHCTMMESMFMWLTDEQRRSKLTELYLGFSELDKHSFLLVSMCTSLTSLSVSICCNALSPNDLVGIQNMKNLVELSFFRITSNIRPADIAAFFEGANFVLKQLFSFDCYRSGWKIDDSSVERIVRSCPALAEFHLEVKGITSEGVGRINELRNLRRLRFYCSDGKSVRKLEPTLLKHLRNVLITTDSTSPSLYHREEDGILKKYFKESFPSCEFGICRQL